ncbi:MAG TPA: D-alanyl-lipoteichoic acid biosynthesis protein DltD [Gemmataceae bacterium]|nr:D-alanyl-lipoteichoic acid biosynthesis protein DltD [Gemmataceae bacterium]
MKTRSFTVGYLLSFTGSLGLALAINWLGNHSSLFPSCIRPSMGDRAWKTRRLDEASQEGRLPQVIILGSSRMMQIQPPYVEAITGKKTFNYAVRVGNPTDFLAELRYLLKIGCKPEMIIAGVDDSAFAYQSIFLGNFGDEIFGHMGLFLEVPLQEKVRILASVLQRQDVGSTMASLSGLASQVAWIDNLRQVMKRKPRTSPRVQDADMMLLQDGYVVFCRHLLARQNGTFKLEDNLEENIRDFGSRMCTAILEPAARYLDEFEAFLSLAHKNSIEVHVITTPYHPEWIRRVFNERVQHARHELARSLETTCHSYGAHYMDLSDVRSFQGDPNEFYDAIHQTATNIQRMVNVIFGLPARSIASVVPSDLEITSNPPTVTSLTTQ